MYLHHPQSPFYLAKFWFVVKDHFFLLFFALTEAPIHLYIGTLHSCISYTIGNTKGYCYY